MYKISFFVPILFADKVKRAVFLTGAGRIGAYDSCCWETVGTGQFRPLSGSDPFIGKKGELEKVEELKEMTLEYIWQLIGSIWSFFSDYSFAVGLVFGVSVYLVVAMSRFISPGKSFLVLLIQFCKI